VAFSPRANYIDCVCVYIYIYTCARMHELKFITVNVQKYAKEQNFEITAIQINFYQVRLTIITIYRVPMGNFDYFLHTLDYILSYYYKNNKTP
jgi:hypothetical protein